MGTRSERRALDRKRRKSGGLIPSGPLVYIPEPGTEIVTHLGQRIDYEYIDVREHAFGPITRIPTGQRITAIFGELDSEGNRHDYLTRVPEGDRVESTGFKNLIVSIPVYCEWCGGKYDAIKHDYKCPNCGGPITAVDKLRRNP